MGMYKPRPRLAQLYETDSTIFNSMVLPTGLSVDTLKPALLTECGELDTIFTSAASLKAYLPIWCAVHSESWTRILAALSAEYNPIHNYDRTDTETESGTTTGTRAGSSTSSTSESTSEEKSNASAIVGNTSTGDGGQDTSTTDLAGFNSETYAKDGKTVTEYGKTGHASSITSNSGSEHTSGSNAQTTDSAESSTEAGTEIRERTLRAAGNIGTTRTQEMIADEIELRTRENMYYIIIENFRAELCVGVW